MHKVLIDSRAVISLCVQHDRGPLKYHNTDHSNEPLDKRWVTHVFNVKETLHLQIVDFKLSHIFIICNRLPEADFFFGIDLQKWYSLSYCWESDRHLFMQKDGSFLTYHQKQGRSVWYALVKSTLKIPLRHNGTHNSTIPIRIEGHDLQDQVAYFYWQSTYQEWTWPPHPYTSWHLQHKR